MNQKGEIKCEDEEDTCNIVVIAAAEVLTRNGARFTNDAGSLTSGERTSVDETEDSEKEEDDELNERRHVYVWYDESRRRFFELFVEVESLCL